MLGGNERKLDMSLIPTAVFTLPPMASVGLTEKKAAENGRNYRVNSGETTKWFSSRRIGETVSGYKAIIDKDDNTLIGMHMLGHNSEEVINLLAFAMKQKATVDEILDVLYVYPSVSSNLSSMLG
jgi:glutathione reductase (NADPH)